MTLTQELAQALRELSFAAQITGGVAGPDSLLMEKIDKAGAALARYDAEPPTSRGSEGEVKPACVLQAFVEVLGLEISLTKEQMDRIEARARVISKSA